MDTQEDKQRPLREFDFWAAARLSPITWRPKAAQSAFGGSIWRPKALQDANLEALSASKTPTWTSQAVLRGQLGGPKRIFH